MKILKSLTFKTLTVSRENPIIARRAKLIRRLEEQKRLAEDPSFVVTVSKWVRSASGSRELSHLQKRVRPWWREDALGTIMLTVRYGSKPIEFEKGKTAIVVTSKDQLIPTLNTVIDAVRAAELDEHLSQLSKARVVSKSK